MRLLTKKVQESRRAVARILGGLVMLGGCASAPPPPVNLVPSPAAVAAVAPVKRALLIGITEYQSEEVVNLTGSVNDVNLMRDVLVSRLGFAPSNVELLTDMRATRSAILSAISRLVRGTGPRDVLFIHFVGHGKQVPDTDGDEPSGYDEGLISYDGLTPGVSPILDDELAPIFSRLRTTARLIVVLDTQNGAGLAADVTRSAGLLSAAIAAVGDGLEGPIGPEGKAHGLLTLALTGALMDGDPSRPVREVVRVAADRAAELLEGRGAVVARVEAARPVAVGAVARLAEPLVPPPYGPAAAQAGTPGGAISDAASARSAAEASNAFAADLYRAIAKDAGNLGVSPLGLESLLALFASGARGATAAELAAALHLDSLGAGAMSGLQQLTRDLGVGGAVGGYDLSFATALWVDDGLALEAPFRTLAQDSFRAAIRQEDFSSPGTERAINQWVSQATSQRIRSVVPEGVITPNARLAGVNALYFKGVWESPFDVDKTADEPFRLADGRVAQAPMMHQKGRFRSLARDGLSVLEMPYARSDLAMLVIVPDSHDGLPRVEGMLSPALFDEWLDGLEQGPCTVVIPRFAAASRLDVAATVASLGAGQAFTHTADFSGITATRPLGLSGAFHGATIEIDEQGSEAAAASAVVLAEKGERPPAVFRADRPFLFLIRDARSGAILFLGRVVDPRDRDGAKP